MRTETVLAICRAGMDDVAVANVDSLDDSASPRLDDAGNLEALDRVQHLRQGGFRQISTIFEIGSHNRLDAVSAGLTKQVLGDAKTATSIASGQTAPL